MPGAGIFPSAVNTHGALTLFIGAEGIRRIQDIQGGESKY